LAGFRQRLEEILPIHIIQKNILPPVPPAHDTCPAVALAKADDTSPRDIGHVACAA
jgi:hypothetical protein